MKGFVMSVSNSRYQTVSLLLSSLTLALVSGCAQMPVQNGSANGNVATTTQPSSSPCNPGVAAGVGALAGALLGKGKGHIVGAVLGAGIGALACTAYNYHSRQVRDAKTVEADYIKQRGTLPANNTVTSYRSSLDPNGTVQAGNAVALKSSIVVVNGTRDTAPQMAETLTLFSPDGKQVSTVTKPATDVSGTGEYQTDFNFNLPKGIQNGRYVVRSTLQMNNQTVETNEMPMLVVS
jgi:Glycine zipper